MGETKFELDEELIIISVYRNNMHTKAILVNTLIHELSHSLLTYRNVNGGHDNEFFYIGSCILTILMSCPELSSINFLPISQCYTKNK